MSTKQKVSIFGIIFTHLFWPKRENVTSRALMIPFLAIHAKKGEKWAQSKRTAPPSISNFKNSVLNIFQLVSYRVQKGEKVVFQNDTSKPSWTLRGGSLLGGVLFSQRRSIWNRGRKFQILKMLCKILFIHLWLLAKELWKGFTKEFAKTKLVTRGASVVQNVI
jgi:hypothetical protein